MNEWQAADRFPGDTLLRDRVGGSTYELAEAGWELRGAAGNGARAVSAAEVAAAVGALLKPRVRTATIRRLHRENERLSREITKLLTADAAADIGAAVRRLDQAARDLLDLEARFPRT